jgi:hypothetical protein
MKRSRPSGGLPNVEELDTGLQCDDQLAGHFVSPTTVVARGERYVRRPKVARHRGFPAHLNCT